ncbi:MAG: type II secretion system protein [Candidatus Riflebacteria bacterium]|nr:type II secretion system protein [Candidatus Riflebacteria bacterium]
MIQYKRRSAFTTPELLMTLVVFSMGILPLIVLFQTSHTTTAKAKNLMVAQSLGRSIIDEVRSYSFIGVKSDFSKFNYPWKKVSGPVVESDNTSVKYPDYYGRFETMMVTDEIKEKDANNNDVINMYSVKLTIRWSEPGKPDQTLGFGTLVVNNEAK